MELYGVSLLLTAVAVSCAYQYDTLWYDDMPLDHFSYATDKTFKLRYLKNDTHWEKGSPIFFYCGNEGDIVLFAENTGFVWEHAKDFKAMVLFAEHRFYGQTLPFGNRSYESPEHLGYLSSEQALADYAVLIRYLKSTIDGAEDSPVIAFGGSYGGMLAAWMRQKYPDTVIGAVAASAPVLQFTHVTPCNTFTHITTRTFNSSGTNCANSIRKFHEVIAEKIKTAEGRAFLTETLALCPDSELTSAANLTDLNGFLTAAWGYLAMIDYPYATNFVANVPAWPVKEVCKHLTNDSADDETLIKNVAAGLSVYTNYSGQTPCNTFAQQTTSSLGDSGWNFQSCTEMVMPMCNDKEDMFPPSKWNFSEVSADCFQQFGVRPRENWAITNYGGLDLRGASNIIYREREVLATRLLPLASGRIVCEQLETAGANIDYVSLLGMVLPLVFGIGLTVYQAVRYVIRKKKKEQVVLTSVNTTATGDLRLELVAEPDDEDIPF